MARYGGLMTTSQYMKRSDSCCPSFAAVAATDRLSNDSRMVSTFERYSRNNGGCHHCWVGVADTSAAGFVWGYAILGEHEIVSKVEAVRILKETQFKP
jgi:hypothetical protein